MSGVVNYYTLAFKLDDTSLSPDRVTAIQDLIRGSLNYITTFEGFRPLSNLANCFDEVTSLPESMKDAIQPLIAHYQKNYPSNWRDYEPTIQRACELVSDPIFPFWQQGALVRYVSRISSLVVSEGVILPTEPSSGKTLKEAPESLAIAANQKNTFYTVNVLNGDIALIKQDNFYAIEIKNLSVDCQLKQHKHHHGHNPSISLFTLKISGRMAVSLTADESGAYQAHFANPPVYEICAMSSKREGLDLLNAIFHHNNLLEAKPELIPEKAITITQEEIINKEKVMRSYDVVRTSTVITAPENLDVQSFLRYLYSFTVDQTEMEAIRALKAALKQYVKGGPRHHHVREAESALEALSAISFIQEGLKNCLEKVAKALPIAPSPTGEMAKKIKPLLNALVTKTGAPSVTVESELKDFQAEFLKLCDLFRKLGLQPEEFNTPPQPNSLSWVASKFDELQKHAYILSEPELHAAYQDLYKCLITQYSKDSRTLLEIFHALRKRTPFSNYYRFSIENDNRRFLTQLERLKNDSSIKLTYELEITPPARSPIAELPRDSDESDEERAREIGASTPRSAGSLSGFHTPIAPSPPPLDESHEGASTTIERRTVLSRKSMASARSKAYSRAQRFDDGSATILVITACAPSPISLKGLDYQLRAIFPAEELAHTNQYSGQNQNMTLMEELKNREIALFQLLLAVKDYCLNSRFSFLHRRHHQTECETLAHALEDLLLGKMSIQPGIISRFLTILPEALNAKGTVATQIQPELTKIFTPLAQRIGGAFVLSTHADPELTEIRKTFRALLMALPTPEKIVFSGGWTCELLSTRAFQCDLPSLKTYTEDLNAYSFPPALKTQISQLKTQIENYERKTNFSSSAESLAV